MANVGRVRSIYYGATSGSDPFANVNTSTLYKPGELGVVVEEVGSGRRGQLVQLDSGATAATATGVVAAGQLAFWKDKSQALVTNDAKQANAVNAPAGGWANAGNQTLDARNFVAGVFQVAATAGNYTIILQRTDIKAGFNVKITGTPNAGDNLVANTGTNADAAGVNAGTAPTCMVIGQVVGAVSGGKIPCWVNLKEQD
jgi:hypothetical protein